MNASVKNLCSSIKLVDVSMGNIETVTCCVRHMPLNQINTSACVFLLTMCVRWAACCVWAQRWSGRRGKGCWIRPGAAERSQWWTAADELAPPGWSWTPRPRTTSSPVATHDKHTQTSWLQKKQGKKKSCDLLSPWSATILQQSPHGPWNPARLYHRCRTSTAEEVRRGKKKLKTPQNSQVSL